MIERWRRHCERLFPRNTFADGFCRALILWAPVKVPAYIALIAAVWWFR